jgi:hypothetical protein
MHFGWPGSRQARATNSNVFSWEKPGLGKNSLR